MLVKCQLCGNKIDRSTAYKMSNGKTNKYYCSEREYVDWHKAKEKEKADKNRMYNAVTAILGYPTQNSALWLEHKRWLLLKSNAIIAQYLEENRDYLASAIARLSGNEYGKIRYLSTVLCNNLKDYQPREEPKIEIKNSTEEYYETKYKPKARVGLMNLEEYDE